MESNLTKYLQLDELVKIQQVKIGIAGCGGIGSNCANNLLRLGFRDFILIDFDRVDYTNLNRQFYFYNQIGNYKTEMLKNNLQIINPDVLVKTNIIKVNSENVYSLFKECDMVIEGFDNPANKKMIIEGLYSRIPLITTSGLGDYWKLDDIKIREVNKNLTIIGDLVSDTEKSQSPLSPGVSVTAGKVAGEVLKKFLRGIYA